MLQARGWEGEWAADPSQKHLSLKAEVGGGVGKRSLSHFLITWVMNWQGQP